MMSVWSCFVSIAIEDAIKTGVRKRQNLPAEGGYLDGV